MKRYDNNYGGGMWPEDYGRRDDERSHRSNRYSSSGWHRYEHDNHRNYGPQEYEQEPDYYRNEDNTGFSQYNNRQNNEQQGYAGNRQGYHNRECGREDQLRQGYGSGRMGGYSGSAFGGANYSSHGDFGGAPEYGAMSGYGGNSDGFVSSSGYGGGYSTRFNQNEQNYRGGNDDERGNYGYSERNIRRPGRSHDSYNSRHRTDW